MDISLASFTSLPDNQLLATARTLADDQRQTSAMLIAVLAEIDARRLYLGQRLSSLFGYCTKALHLSEDAAYNHMRAARVALKWPEVLNLIADGSLTLTAVRLLSGALTHANHTELLAAAAHKTTRDVEALVAARQPQPAVAHYKMQITISKATHDTLCRIQDLMRHTNPSGDPAVIVDRALTLLLEHLERTRYGTVKRPRRRVPSPKPGSRHIPAVVKREVSARDGRQCAFVGEAGRCEETAFLEYHHVVPHADGGESSTANIQLRCRAHNAYEAEQWFGPLIAREKQPVYGSITVSCESK